MKAQIQKVEAKAASLGAESASIHWYIRTAFFYFANGTSKAISLSALSLVITLSAQAATKPTCWNQSESCRAQWFEYGDETGDYGVIDAEVDHE